MPFKASDTAALDWDFRPYVDAHGVTPEPDPDAVAQFQFGMKNVTKGVIPEGVDTDDPAAMAKAMDDITLEDYKAIQDVMLDLVAELTGGSPSREQIGGLKFRLQRAYVGSLMADLMDPTAATGATRRGPVAAKRG